MPFQWSLQEFCGVVFVLKLGCPVKVDGSRKVVNIMLSKHRSYSPHHGVTSSKLRGSGGGVTRLSSVTPSTSISTLSSPGSGNIEAPGPVNLLGYKSKVRNGWKIHVTYLATFALGTCLVFIYQDEVDDKDENDKVGDKVMT